MAAPSAWSRVVGPLLGGALLGMALGASAVAEPRGRLETAEALFVLRVPAPFADVLGALEAAVQRRNYALGRTNDLDDALRARARVVGAPFDFEHYKVVSFCNLTLAAEALAADPHVGALMPCRLAVYVRPGSAEVVVVAMRPTYLLGAWAPEALRRLAARVEADLLAILDMVVEP